MEKTEQNKTKQNVALIGFMGTGKSAVSAWLCKNAGYHEIDVDAAIVKAEKMEISDIFAQKGEAYFRVCETAALRGLAGAENAVIACGGGAVLRAENVALLRSSARIVLLTATPETVLRRVERSNARPILNGHKNIADITELMEKRANAYAAAADFSVPTDNRTVAEICDELLKCLNAASANG